MLSQMRYLAINAVFGHKMEAYVLINIMLRHILISLEVWLGMTLS